MKLILQTTAVPAAAIFALAFFAMTPTKVSAGEFCRQDVTGHMTGCGFATIEQCQAASAGLGGDCFRDPNLTASSTSSASNAYASQRRPSHSAKRKGRAPVAIQ
jgi:hypothetical protein